MGLAEKMSWAKSPAAPDPGVNKPSDSIVLRGALLGERQTVQP
jgi:hypothetical protein